MVTRLLLGPPGVLWRLKSYCRSKSAVVSKIAQLIYRLNQFESSCSIAWNSRFSSRPCFPHGRNGIYVAGSSRVGDNCVIFQQVTIGSVSIPDSPRKGAPVIGNDVYIGAGAKIIGAVRIGNNVRIGANAVVYKDVPDNCVVVSGEQRTLQRLESIDCRFYTTKRGGLMYFSKGRFLPVEDEAVLSAFGFRQKNQQG